MRQGHYLLRAIGRVPESEQTHPDYKKGHAMIKEFICGMGMVLDVSGSHYTNHSVADTRQINIATYWGQTANFVRSAVDVEAPKVKAAIAQQLQLKLEK